MRLEKTAVFHKLNKYIFLNFKNLQVLEISGIETFAKVTTVFKGMANLNDGCQL